MCSGKLSLADETLVWKCSVIEGEDEKKKANQMICVFSVNQRIENGSEALWSVMRGKLERAVDDSILK
ncbi:MAG TPA: hypothetical protein DCS01_06545 [Idiomarina abyssalis]|jgi:hypothetical protein|uniref:hypothetical protein n=1 Tax=Idiomarina TaxID=135575 RepID=UPI000C6A1C33|nr:MULTISPECIES: hypothetical protein [Idiomarina]MAB21630.1 hypothetical protein [Idiomarina sp.]MBH93693.1 hypothetical protein [Idiomarina sp.]QZN91000.1 hypothetical protein K5X84_00285 [Idiomarina abyssalis]HAS14941.1 hypothetical protein [Idiomarina abyssalis]|tara:strand:+ start:81 stop:284 length:204 start_codon:yes stop_codon:yes gene_type:complete